MTINWHDKAIQDRLLTAIIASVDNKINVAEVARLYGGNMTYHAVESYLRKFRKDSKDMRGQASGVAAPSPARQRVKKAAAEVSPVKTGGVKTGRVAKKKLSAKIKTEVLEQEPEDMGSEEAEEVQEEV